MKKLTTVLLILCLIVSMLPATVQAAETPIQIDPVTLTNPLYPNAAPHTDPAKPITPRGNEEGYLSDVYAIGAVIRTNMEQRQEFFQVDVQIPDYTQDRAQAVVTEALEIALAHTGEPTQGDYLLWQYSTIGYSAEGSLSGTTGLLTFGFTVEYYTTADQEATVDAAVDQLLEDLALKDKDDYQKLLSVYDYICDNVTYDNAHVNDESYTLQYTAYGALIDGTAVCQGYAVLLYRLALEMGIDSRLISGIGNGGPHGWNILELDDVYYNADATWDAGSTDYQYFLCSQADFQDHFRDDAYDTAAFHEAYPMASTSYVPSAPCDHRYTSTVTAPTCTEAGFTTYTCTKCGNSYTDDQTSPTGHSYSAWTESQAPTCTADGLQVRYCSNCSTSESKTIAAIGHNYGEWIESQAPTCTADGQQKRTCSNCSASETKSIAATGHSYGEWTNSQFPTCTTDGLQERTCANCSASETRSVAATGHSYGSWTETKAATCTADGQQKRTCANCSASETRSVAATGHSYGSWTETKAATCTADGQQKRTCANCSTSETRSIAATGHSYGGWIDTKDATCTADGQQKRACANCSASETRSIAATGHSYSDGKCTRCGQLEPGTVLAPATPKIQSCYSRVQTSVKVTWTVVDDADGYELWRSTTPNDPNSWTRVKSPMGSTNTIYTNQGLTVGVTYYYKVRSFALDGDGERVCSDFSAVSHMPAAVVFNGPYSNATFRIRLRWMEVDGSHGYQIWRKEADGSWKIIKTLGDKGNTLTNDMGSTTAYSNAGLVSGQRYTYRMRAFTITEDGRKVFGAYSDECTVAVMPEAPVLTVASPKAGRAKLTWDQVSGAAGYQIWMSESPDKGFSIVKSVTDGSTAYTKYDLHSGKTYYFKIRAYVEVDGKKTFGDYSQTIAITIQ